MNAARVIVLVIALAAGGLAAMLASRSDPPPPAPVAPPPQAQIETTEILVAKDDVSVGQTLTADNMWQIWPRRALGRNSFREKQTRRNRGMSGSSFALHLPAASRSEGKDH
jgi:pilus assembly protein CpaB